MKFVLLNICLVLTVPSIASGSTVTQKSFTQVEGLKSTKGKSKCYCATFMMRGNGMYMFALMKRVSRTHEARITGFMSDYSFCMQTLNVSAQCR